MQCTYCGKDLDEYERDDPPKDADGDVMCEGCWSEKNESVCDRCGEYCLNADFADEPGNLIAIWQKAPGAPDDLAPGYYRVKRWPIYAYWMIGGHMYSDCLERAADLDEEGRRAALDANTLCSLLCSTCRGEIEERIKTPNVPPLHEV